jgi:hypothetical protein
VGDLGDAADVVLVEVGDDRGGHIGGAIAEALKPSGHRLVLVDVEGGEAPVDDPRWTVGEVVRVGDRGAVLTGVENDEALGVLDHVDVDRAGRQPSP